MAGLKICGLFILICVTLFPEAYGFGRIVGGFQTTIQRRPYMASLQFFDGLSYSHYCGASIISARYLLTAAHCDPGNNMMSFYARVGSATYNSGGQLLKVATFEQHPNYINTSLDYDVALVSFPEGTSILLNYNASIIPLAGERDPPIGIMLTVSGWGVTDESSSVLSLNLREVDLQHFNRDTCKTVYPLLSESQMCIGGSSLGNTGACFGDSGGPAVVYDTQYGVVSGGSSCNAPHIPGIYARLSYIRPWILSVIGQ